MRNPGIDLRIGRKVVGIGETGAQAAAVDQVGGKSGAVPEIGNSSRSGPPLRVVGVDPIVLRISELVRTEEILVGDDIVPALTGPGQVRVGAQIAVRIDGFELDAGILTALILEPIQYQGGTELALIDLVFRHFQIDVGAELQTRQHLLHDADVVDVRPLGLHQIIGRRRRRRLHGCASRRQGAGQLVNKAVLAGAAITCAGGVKLRAKPAWNVVVSNGL